MMARSQDGLNGFVDDGCVISGTLKFKNSFRLDGRVEGAVESSSELLIGEGGSVEGEITVARCRVGGEVRGTIRAGEQVVLHPTARVWAEIITPALVMEEGAFLEGKVTMKQSKAEAPPAKGGRS